MIGTPAMRLSSWLMPALIAVPRRMRAALQAVLMGALRRKELCEISRNL